jgi:hypothetical protein
MLDFRHVTTHRRPRFYPSIGFLIPAQAEMYRFDQSLSKKIGRKAIKLIRKPLRVLSRLRLPRPNWFLNELAERATLG